MHRLRRFVLALAAFAPTAASAEDGPVAAVERIYDSYAASPSTNANAPDMLNASHFSKRINLMIGRMRKRCVKGDICGPDYDLFVNGQDYQLSDIRIDLVSETGDKALVEARFKNFETANDIVFSLSRENSSWVIDEMASSGSTKGPSLSAALKAATR